MASKKEVMIVNRRSKKALQATGLDNGQVVEQAAATGADNQLWTIVEAEGGVKLFNKANGKYTYIYSGRHRRRHLGPDLGGRRRREPAVDCGERDSHL